MAGRERQGIGKQNEQRTRVCGKSENAEIVHNDQELFRKTAHPALKTVRTNR